MLLELIEQLTKYEMSLTLKSSWLLNVKNFEIDNDLTDFIFFPHQIYTIFFNWIFKLNFQRMED